MAYELNYWQRTKEENYECLKTIRLRSVNEIQTLSLPHNRPAKTDQITVDRTDKQSKYFHIVWDSSNPDHYQLER